MKYDSTIKIITLSELVEFPGNPNVMPAKQFDKIVKQMSRDGWIGEPATVWFCKRDNKNYILSGNHRVKAAIGAGIINARCVLIEDDRFKWSHAKKYNLAYNNKGEFNLDLLNDFVLSIGVSDVDELALDTGLDEDYLLGLFNAGETEGDDEASEKVRAVSKLGDLWELGRHRVLCGDSLTESSYKKIIGDSKIDFIFTDPPYDLDDIAWSDFCFKLCDKNIFVMHSDKNQVKLATKHEKYFKKFHVIIFNNPILMNSNQAMSGHTLISQFCKLKQGFNNKNDQFSTVYKHDKINQLKDKEHRHKKSTEFIEQFITHYSKKNNTIMDCFLGSGTTLIAAEKTGRTCYGIELDKKNVDIIIYRYIDWMKTNSRPFSIKKNGKKFNPE